MMRRFLKITAIIVCVLVLVAGYVSQLPRMRAEENALVEIATIGGDVVKYDRYFGVAGVEFVTHLWLPQTELSEDQLRRIAGQFQHLPGLRRVLTDKAVIADDVLKAVQADYPNIRFNEQVYFTSPPQFRFAEPIGGDRKSD